MTALEQGMGGVALILGFALLCSRRLNLALLWTGAQAAAVSLAVVGRSGSVAAVANGVLSGVLVPVVLHRVCHAYGPPDERDRLPLVLGAACALSLLAAEAGPLSLPLAILLIGLLLVATRRSASFQAFGLCGMQQAALLATDSGGQGGSPLTLMLVVPALPALAAASLWLGRLEQTAPP